VAEGGPYRGPVTDDDAATVPALARAEAAGLWVSVDRATDGVLVVFVDTPGVPEDDAGPQLRLYLNEKPVFENPTAPD
jgi:hypothetical protein